MTRDWVGILESLYEIERPFSEWMLNIAARAKACAADDATVLAFTYDASRPSRLVLSPCVSTGEAQVMKHLFEGMAAMELPEAFLEATFRTMRAGSQIEALPSIERLFGLEPATGVLAEAFEAVHGSSGSSQGETLEARSVRFRAFTGFAEIQIANGINTDGHGLWLGTCLPTYEALTPERRGVLEQVATHLSAAWRLRRKLEAAAQSVTERAEAVLSPGGKLEHAVGAAAEPAVREALTRAARAVDAARTRARRSDPSLGLAEWTGLVARRWSLVEVVERDGRRYLVAQENELGSRGGEALTVREREVANLVALGLSNKMVAYELGITAATVGVLLHRAMKKLGLADRNALRLALNGSSGING